MATIFFIFSVLGIRLILEWSLRHDSLENNEPLAGIFGMRIWARSSILQRKILVRPDREDGSTPLTAEDVDVFQAKQQAEQDKRYHLRARKEKLIKLSGRYKTGHLQVKEGFSSSPNLKEREMDLSKKYKTTRIDKTEFDRSANRSSHGGLGQKAKRA